MSEKRRGRPETPRTGYAARVYELRRENNLSAQQAAERWGIAAHVLYAYEKGRTKIPADVLCSIADCEGVSTDWLLGRTDERRTAR